jgi:hypothetical protein
LWRNFFKIATLKPSSPTPILAIYSRGRNGGWKMSLDLLAPRIKLIAVRM